MAASETDRIEKKIVLRAPRARVWRALTNAEEFGTWFGARLAGGAFAPGAQVRGPITHPGYEHLTMEMTIERVEPERAFSWRWHPGAPDPGTDYSKDPTTLVEFTLEDVPEGTLLTVVESGFDRIPVAYREKSFRENSGGWAEQMTNIQRHVAAA